MRPVLVALGLVFGAALLIVFFTPVGFPYGADTAAPSRQRHVIHVSGSTLKPATATHSLG